MKGRYTPEQLATIMKIKEQYDSTERDFSIDDENHCLTANKLASETKKKQSKKGKKPSREK